jgi:hypothetical protein
VLAITRHVAISGLLFVQPAIAESVQYKLKCPLHADDGRAVAIHIDIEAGSIASVSGLPPEWSIRINNGPSMSATFDGSMAVGAAALECRKLSDLAFEVRKQEEFGSRFRLGGFVTATTDFEHTKKLSLQKSDFLSGHRP